MDISQCSVVLLPKAEIQRRRADVGHTLALSEALGNGHAGSRQRGAVNEGIGLARTALLEAASLDERLELIQTGRQLNVPRLCELHKRERGRNHDRSLESHGSECVREAIKRIAKERL